MTRKANDFIPWLGVGNAVDIPRDSKRPLDKSVFSLGHFKKHQMHSIACNFMFRADEIRLDENDKTVVTVWLEWKQADTVLATTKCGQANKIKESNDNKILYVPKSLNSR
uniref:Uncharacterized protein n=1 Tax=Glossina austeni TaxID=7395 RepID=A0A1A9VND0_GLOAU